MIYVTEGDDEAVPDLATVNLPVPAVTWPQYTTEKGRTFYLHFYLTTSCWQVAA